MTTIAPNEVFELGHYIARARHLAGMDQDQLAAAVEVSRTKISRWETGKAIPDVMEFKRIADETGQEWLLDVLAIICGLSQDSLSPAQMAFELAA